ncbi:hypothetical protein BGZ95_006178 [Linnemannia exigua]|uniref:Uncharacterized protein n=1 Tax=Linnemannia exigua TaxID=604196 RepID=A0AAD4H0X5_9FUNG|nr:hypothetical protein BGZ95_006178 [Linnemannia exigua]
MDSNKTQHTVIDALDKTRQEHPHHSHQSNNPTGPLSHAVGNDVTDEILEQSEAVHIPKDDGTNNNNNNNSSSNNNYSVDNKDNKDKLIGLSTTATLPSSTWQPLASKSTNQLPAANVLASVHGYGAQDHHDKPSVLPEILPGFKDRMADIHHATLKSVADVNPSSGAGAAGGEGGRWTGGTMFPAMTTGFKNPFGGGGSVSQQHNQQQQHVGSATATEDANRRMARSSILYESSDLEESTTKLTDDDDDDKDHNSYQRSSTSTAGAGERRPSSTLVQGGQGGRRWSHELSPEKAGLDVVLDKIQQHPPATPASTHVHHPHRLTAEEKQLAAGAAFGGSEESGDQNILLDGLLHQRQQHDAERSAASTLDVISGVAIPTTTATAATPTSTRGVEAEQVLKAAPSVGQEHQKSIFHLAGNPETKKSLLLNHPESLGYHNVTKDQQQQQQQGMEDSTLAGLAGLGAQHQRNAASGQDVSKTRR